MSEKDDEWETFTEEMTPKERMEVLKRRIVKVDAMTVSFLEELKLSKKRVDLLMSEGDLSNEERAIVSAEQKRMERTIKSFENKVKKIQKIQKKEGGE